MSADLPARVLAVLDRYADAGRTAHVWLRDDDAIEPTAALDRLLSLTSAYGVPATLAVIPAATGPALSDTLSHVQDVDVVVHGWSHANHAGSGSKKAELGAERPAATVLWELGQGFRQLSQAHGARFQPVLVPPWNRVDAGLLPHLSDLGFRALSVFGPEKPGPMPLINTHVDVMDWHGTRGCRDWGTLDDEIAARLDACLANCLAACLAADAVSPKPWKGGNSMGLLTHHLVHDEAVWAYLERLFRATSGHPACRWTGIGALLQDAAC
jgi:hypothetical protein